MEKVYSNVEQARRRHPFLTAFVILLAAGLVGIGWYAYPILKRYEARLERTQSQIPVIERLQTQIPVIEKFVLSLDEQNKALENKISDGTYRQDDLRVRLNRTRSELMARIDSVKRQADDASTAMVQRLRSDIATQIATQIDGIKTQLARLETSGDGDRDQIASLRQELAQIRSQVNQQSQELAEVQGRVAQNAASTGQDLAVVKTTQQQVRRDFDSYADKFAVKRVDFEVNKNQDSTVAPGISMQVNGTDVSYQRVNGSILVAPDQRTIWLRQLKVQEPVFLSSFADGRTRELVITGVSKDGAVGYVLVPAQDAAILTAANRARGE